MITLLRRGITGGGTQAVKGRKLMHVEDTTRPRSREMPAVRFTGYLVGREGLDEVHPGHS